MSDKINIIFDLVKTIDSKQDQQLKEHYKLLLEVQKNTRDLEDHIEGVKQNRASIKVLTDSNRPITLKKAGAYLISFLGFVTTAAALTVYITKLIGK